MKLAGSVSFRSMVTSSGLPRSIGDRWIFGRVGQADGEKRDASFRFLAGPVEKIRLREVQIELEGIFSVGGIARFHGGDFAVDAVESGDGLAEFFPLRLRRAAEGEAQGEFVVAAKVIVQRGGELAEIAHAALRFRRAAWKGTADRRASVTIFRRHRAATSSADLSRSGGESNGTARLRPSSPSRSIRSTDRARR